MPWENVRTSISLELKYELIHLIASISNTAGKCSSRNLTWAISIFGGSRSNIGRFPSLITRAIRDAVFMLNLVQTEYKLTIKVFIAKVFACFVTKIIAFMMTNFLVCMTCHLDWRKTYFVI